MSPPALPNSTSEPSSRRGAYARLVVGFDKHACSCGWGLTPRWKTPGPAWRARWWRFTMFNPSTRSGRSVQDRPHGAAVPRSCGEEDHLSPRLFRGHLEYLGAASDLHEVAIAKFEATGPKMRCRAGFAVVARHGGVFSKRKSSHRAAVFLVTRTGPALTT